MLVKSTKVQKDYYDHPERRCDCDKEEGSVMSDFKSPMVTSKYNDYYRHRQTKTQTVLSSQFTEGSQCPGCSKRQRQKIETIIATDTKTKTISPSQLEWVSYSLNALKGKEKKDKDKSTN